MLVSSIDVCCMKDSSIAFRSVYPTYFSIWDTFAEQGEILILACVGDSASVGFVTGRRKYRNEMAIADFGTTPLV